MNISSFAKSVAKNFGLWIVCFAIVVGSFLMPAPALADTVIVKMGSDGGQLLFVPKVVKIKVGDTVKWVNNKAFPHNVVFKGHTELSHKKLSRKSQEVIESTFNETGEFSYFCSPHRGAGMIGKVIVSS